MKDLAIQADKLSKLYHLGATLQHDTLRDHLVQAFKGLTRGVRKKDAPRARSEKPSFWALKDVSFDIHQGEVVGIIGRNGAGKSTLLKVLSQITEPTSGTARIRGRLASLLEVGTGFHPELSGRENIFLNGAILGMSKAEIRSKFDEIVAFAEVERFLDTPVKRYSSGMYVRLAFAVAAHLEPEILIIDEVLAVGDAAFQHKCLGKMKDVAKQDGRTVLFVSHNMSAVQSLCHRCIHLKGGQVEGIGDVETQIQLFLEDMKHSRTEEADTRLQMGGVLEVSDFHFSPQPVHSGETVQFSLTLKALERTRILDLALLVYTSFGHRVGIADLRRPKGENDPLNAGQSITLQGELRNLPLVEGDYEIGLYLQCDQFYSDFYNVTPLSIMPAQNPPDPLPRPARHRGCLEFDYSCTRSTF